MADVQGAGEYSVAAGAACCAAAAAAAALFLLESMCAWDASGWLHTL
jgi:hypothetical protein